MKMMLTNIATELWRTRIQLVFFQSVISIEVHVHACPLPHQTCGYARTTRKIFWQAHDMYKHGRNWASINKMFTRNLLLPVFFVTIVTRTGAAKDV